MNAVSDGQDMSMISRVKAALFLWYHFKEDSKVLLVDDILTTGSTLFSCLQLIKKLHPKKIQILVVAKTKKKPKKQY